jgi:hypothetical protein
MTVWRFLVGSVKRGRTAEHGSKGSSLQHHLLLYEFKCPLDEILLKAIYLITVPIV